MGVFHTTFVYDKIKISQKYPGFYRSLRKREFLPSSVAGNKKPQPKLGLKEVKAASRNERNLVNAALLSD
jgi:hypothetical protein